MTTDPKQPEAQEAPASEPSAEHAHDALPDDLEFLKARIAEHTKGLQQILDDFDAGYLLKCCASMLANRDAAARYAALGKQPIQEAPSDAKDAARYRWLRDQVTPDDFYSGAPRWSVAREQGGYGEVFRGEKLDEAIDSALQSHQEGK